MVKPSLIISRFYFATVKSQKILVPHNFKNLFMLSPIKGLTVSWTL